MLKILRNQWMQSELLRFQFKLWPKKGRRLPIKNNLLLTKKSLLLKMDLLFSKVKPPKLQRLTLIWKSLIMISATTEDRQKKRLTQHVRMKHCFSLDLRCFRHDNVHICSDVIAVWFINQKPWKTRKSVKNVERSFYYFIRFFAIYLFTLW